MKAIVNKELCIGCGLCESICPEVFEMQDNIAVVKTDTVPELSPECVQQAVKDCPTSAISAE